jgi:hypothetical protein
MDEAANNPTPAPRRASLAEYAQQRIGEIKDPSKAYKAILHELVRETEGRRPYRYKRVDDVEGRWREDGLPVGYFWSDAHIDWGTSTATWPERLGPRYRSELEIYSIEVVVWDAPPWIVPAPADEPIQLEPEPLEPKLELEPEPEPPEPEPVPADGAVNDSPVDEAVLNASEWETEGNTASAEDPTDKNDRLLLILTGLSELLKADMAPAQVTKLAKRPYLKRWPEIKDDPKSKFPDRTTVRRVFKKFINTQK